MESSDRVHVKLSLDGREVEGAVELPRQKGPRRLLLPVLQRLTDAVVSIAEQRTAEEGAAVSCTKGCDACCRQMVPISPTEAYALAELLNAMEPLRAQRILSRFEKATEALDRAELLDRLIRRAKLTPEELRRLDRDYFAAAVPCPFLERGACSIHPDRPLACREFLVTSDPAHCANPASEKITQVQLSTKISRALLATDTRPWLPLILARQFTAKHPERPSPQTPAAELKKILNTL